MKHKRTRSAFIIAMALTLIFTMSATAFGAARQVVGLSLYFEAISSTKANAGAIATSDSQPSSMTIKVTLQSAPLGSSSYSNVSGVSPLSKTGSNVGTIGVSGTFPITSDKEYRIKIEATDVVGGLTSTTTCYQALVR